MYIYTVIKVYLIDKKVTKSFISIVYVQWLFESLDRQMRDGETFFQNYRKKHSDKFLVSEWVSF